MPRAHLAAALIVSLAIVLLLSNSTEAQKAKGGPKLVPTTAYESLLGVYSNDSKPIPFITLAVPNGSNMLSDEVLGKMRGRISIGEIGYRGSGYFSVPETGTYEFDSDLAEITINGRAMGFDRKPGTIELAKGVYSIQVYESNHGQPYLASNRLTIRQAGGALTLPVFNSGKDIQRFLSTPIAGSRTIVTHEFDPEVTKLDIKLPKR